MKQTKMMTLGENNTAVIKDIRINKGEYRKSINQEDLPKLSENRPVNKDNIPINTLLIGKAKGNLYVMCVHEDFYSVGNKKFISLSGAAQYVTEKRRNGREFWKTTDWVSVEDAYSK